jgi:hypothetical protein
MSTDLRLRQPQSPDAKIVFPTSVSVPVIKKPFSLKIVQSSPAFYLVTKQKIVFLTLLLV